MQNVRPYVKNQTNVYYVLMALEAEKKQAAQIAAYLKRHGENLTVKQISTALQQLRKEGLASYDGRWHRVLSHSGASDRAGDRFEIELKITPEFTEIFPEVTQKEPIHYGPRKKRGKGNKFRRV